MLINFEIDDQEHAAAVLFAAYEYMRMRMRGPLADRKVDGHRIRDFLCLLHILTSWI